MIDLLNDAVWAPFHSVKEPWRFILFMEKGRRTFAEAVALAYSREEVEKWGERMMYQYCHQISASFGHH